MSCFCLLVLALEKSKQGTEQKKNTIYVSNLASLAMFSTDTELPHSSIRVSSLTPINATV